MTMVLSTLFSHWLRHPGQLVLMVLGLSLSTTLWSAIQAVNSEARSSYAEAAKTLSQQAIGRLEDGDKPLTISDYAKLRRAGIDASPIIESRLEFGSGSAATSVNVIGIDPFSYPRVDRLSSALETQPGISGATPTLLDMLADPPQVFISPSTDRSQLNALTDWYFNEVSFVPQGTVIVDISVAERIIGSGNTISHILLQDPNDWASAQELVLHGRLVEPSDNATGDIQQLTRSFHLNLTAFGLLSFAVGLFIVQGMITLSVEQRRKTIAILRYLGVTTRQLSLALLVEVLSVALLSGILGIVLGYLLASLLISDVSATLAGLYGAEIAGSLQLRLSWVTSGLAMALLGASLASVQALLRLKKTATQLTKLAHTTSRSSPKSLILLSISGIFLIITGYAVLWTFDGLLAGFVFLAGLMLGAALLLPSLCYVLTHFAGKQSKRPLAQFFWADLRTQLPGLSMALMALMLAVATNIGVGTMVSSFRQTFVGWLDQRLSAQVYVHTQTAQNTERVYDWASQNDIVVLPLYRVNTQLSGRPVTLLGLVDDVSYRENWPLLKASSDAWELLFQGTSILINEQMARSAELSVGDQVTLPGYPQFSVAGIYSDYGNPTGQVILPVETLLKSSDEVELQRIGLRSPRFSSENIINSLRASVDLPADDVISQPQIKSLSLSIFDRTFVITGALNILTLAVAGFALFTSFLTQWSQRLPHLSPLWAMGVSRPVLALLDLTRSLLLASFCFLLALPLGLLLAWALLSVVNVEAFGWQLPMVLFPSAWLQVFGFTFLAATFAAVVPSLRLLRASPAQLLGSFSNDR